MRTQPFTNPFLVPNWWDKVGQMIGDFRFWILDPMPKTQSPKPNAQNPKPGTRTKLIQMYPRIDVQYKITYLPTPRRYPKCDEL
jgi:hypothetical protein